LPLAVTQAIIITNNLMPVLLPTVLVHARGWEPAVVWGGTLCPC
jgi:hypothetical protein